MFQLRPFQIPSFQLNSLLNTVTTSDKNQKNAYFEPFTLILWLVLGIYHHLRIY